MGCLAGLFGALGAASLLRGDALVRSGDARSRLAHCLELASDLDDICRHLTVRGVDRFRRISGAGIFDLSLRGAIAGGAVGLFLTWLSTGDAGLLGETLGLPEHAAPRFRATAVLTAAWIMVAYWRIRFGRQSRLTLCCWVVSIGAAASLGAASVGDLDAAAFPGHDSRYGTFLGSVALPSAAVAVVATSGATAVAIALAGLTAVAVNGDGALADGFACATGVLLVGWMDGKRGRGGFGCPWLVAWPVVVAALYGLLVLDAALETPSRGRLVLAFLVFLPVLLAPCLAMSIGLTVVLLRRCAEPTGPSPLRQALAGIAGKSMLILPLLGTLAAGVHMIAWADAGSAEPPLIDVPGVLARLVRWPMGTEAIWLCAAFGTLLVPDAIVLLLFSQGIALWILPDRLRDRLVARVLDLQRHDYPGRCAVAACLIVPAFVCSALAGLVASGALILLAEALWLCLSLAAA